MEVSSIMIVFGNCFIVLSYFYISEIIVGNCFVVFNEIDDFNILMGYLDQFCGGNFCFVFLF